MQDIWVKLLLLISRKKASLIKYVSAQIRLPAYNLYDSTNTIHSADTWEATLRTAINQHQSAYWLTNPLKICEYKRLPLRKRVFILKSVVDWVLEDSELLQRYIDRQKTDKMVRHWSVKQLRWLGANCFLIAIHTSWYWCQWQCLLVLEWYEETRDLLE